MERRPTHWQAIPALIAALSLLLAIRLAIASETAPASFRPVDAVRASSYGLSSARPERKTWRRLAPKVREVQVRSSIDGVWQPVLFYDSGSEPEKPLLVVLHSWSSNYLQTLDIPYAQWAAQNDWVFIHPEFRGTNSRPEATASDLAVQDVVDAVHFATRHARVDPKRIYVTGYSGGGMMALVMAGRHPELWGGIVAWSSIVDLVDWYAYNRSQGELRYAREIAASCGGSPWAETRAAHECRTRSPAAALEHAKAASFPIYIAHGVQDRTVNPRHALWAYNVLADPAERFTDDEVGFIASRYALPEHLRAPAADPFFTQAAAPLQLERTSRNVTLALYEGGHDLIYNAGLRWLSAARRP